MSVDKNGRTVAGREVGLKQEEIHTKTGVNVVVQKPGDAFNFPKPGDSISIHYKSFLEDGTQIDDSYKRGQPMNFTIGAGHVIPGWEDVLPLLSKGEIARITVPPKRAYGDKGFPPVIPANANVIYEIELLSLSSSKFFEKSADPTRAPFGSQGQQRK